MNEVDLTISAGGAKQPGSFRLVATLGVAGMLSGLVLATAYQTTKPIIDANNARRTEQAVLKVVPDSTQMHKFALRDGQAHPVGKDERTTDPIVYVAYDDDGRFRGYAIEAEGAGFQDTIRLIYGYDPDGQNIIGMYILESRETPGLGDKIYKDADFKNNFESLHVLPQIVVVKSDQPADNQVDAITGATISSKAVVNIINASNG